MRQTTDLMEDPGVKEAWDKWQGFNLEVSTLEKKLGELNTSISSLRDGSRLTPTKRAALALIAGSPVDNIEHEIEGLRREHNAERLRLPIVREAVGMQKAIYESECTRASREICEKIEPEYREVVARLAKGMIALGEAIAAEIDFYDALITGGVMFASDLRRMNIHALGSPRDRNSRLAMWLQEAVQFGLIEEAMVPADWRESWEGKGEIF